MSLTDRQICAIVVVLGEHVRNEIDETEATARIQRIVREPSLAPGLVVLLALLACLALTLCLMPGA